MAKLFKNISLEERYKNSNHNKLPIKPKAGNQGTIVLQPIKPSKELESILLKTIPNAIEKSGAILKAIAKNPKETLPFANTKFRSAISLADRLGQPKTGSTAHLAQYFLSDTYTNYLKINKFGIFNHISTTTIQLTKTSIKQGGEKPVIFNPILSTGLVYVNGAASSFIKLAIPTYDSLLLQGTFFTNGTYYSNTITHVSISPQGINQGSGTNPAIPITIPTIASLQGSGTNPVNSLSVFVLASLQGSGTNPIIAISPTTILGYQGTINNNQKISSITITQPSLSANNIAQSGNLVLGIPSEDKVLEYQIYSNEKGQSGNIILNKLKDINIKRLEKLAWGNTIGRNVSQIRPVDPSYIGPLKKLQSPILQVLRHAADRVLAFFSPIIKHGDSNLPNKVTKEGSHFFQDSVSIPLNIGGPHPNSYETDVQTYIYKLGSGSTSNKSENTVDYTTLGDENKNPTTKVFSTQNLLLGNFSPEDPNKLIGNDIGKGIAQKDTYKANKGRELADVKTVSDTLESYKSLTYGQIETRANSSVKGVNGKDFRTDLDGLANQEELGHVTKQPFPTTDNLSPTYAPKDFDYVKGVIKKTAKYSTIKLTTDTEYTATHIDGITGNTKIQNYKNTKAPDDFLTLKIESMTGQGSVSFKTFITSFNDGFTVNYNDLNYVGRQDTLKTFKGTTRAGAIAFKLPAFSPTELATNYEKLNDLIKIAGVGKGDINNQYIIGPFCKLTVGGWFVQTPCVFGSIKFDIQMSEYAWDLDSGKPQIVDVSMDFTIIGDSKGAPLNATTNTYY